MEEGDARNAIAGLNGVEFEGRTLRVNEAEKASRAAPLVSLFRRGSNRKGRGFSTAFFFVF